MIEALTAKGADVIAQKARRTVALQAIPVRLARARRKRAHWAARIGLWQATLAALDAEIAGYEAKLKELKK